MRFSLEQNRFFKIVFFLFALEIDLVVFKYNFNNDNQVGILYILLFCDDMTEPCACLAIIAQHNANKINYNSSNHWEQCAALVSKRYKMIYHYVDENFAV